MKELFSSGHIVDFILALVALEAIFVIGWRLYKKGGPALLAFISNLLAGTFLLLGLRSALVGASWPLISLCLSAGLLSHLINLVMTWERT